MILSQGSQYSFSDSAFASLTLILYLQIDLSPFSVGMYWVGQKVHLVFFCKIKDIFFIFINNFVDLEILSMSDISCYWLLVGGVQGCCQTSPNTQDSPTTKNSLDKMSMHQETLQITFNTDQSQHFLHILHKSFFAFQLSFHLF